MHKRAAMPHATPTDESLSTNQDPAAEPLPEHATQVVTSWRVSCAGDKAMGLGHPLVWMAISPASGFVECGYCDKRFVIDRDHAGGDH